MRTKLNHLGKLDKGKAPKLAEEWVKQSSVFGKEMIKLQKSCVGFFSSLSLTSSSPFKKWKQEITDHVLRVCFTQERRQRKGVDSASKRCVCVCVYTRIHFMFKLLFMVCFFSYDSCLQIKPSCRWKHRNTLIRTHHRVQEAQSKQKRGLFVQSVLGISRWWHHTFNQVWGPPQGGTLWPAQVTSPWHWL